MNRVVTKPGAIQIHDFETGDLDALTEVEVSAYKVLQQLLKAMDRGDLEAIQDAALRLSGLVSVVPDSPSRVKRAVVAAVFVLGLFNDALGLATWVEETLDDERIAVEAEISPPAELLAGDPVRALPEGGHSEEE